MDLFFCFFLFLSLHCFSFLQSFFPHLTCLSSTLPLFVLPPPGPLVVAVQSTASSKTWHLLYCEREGEVVWRTEVKWLDWSVESDNAVVENSSALLMRALCDLMFLLQQILGWNIYLCWSWCLISDRLFIFTVLTFWKCTNSLFA